MAIPSLPVSFDSPHSVGYSDIRAALVRRPDIEVSQPYEYSILRFEDSALGVEYCQCHEMGRYGSCHHDEPRIGCHVDCASITSGATLARVLEVGALEFEPTPISERRRVHWLQSFVAEILETATRRLPHLPEEVRHSIAASALDVEKNLQRFAAHCSDEIYAGERTTVSSVKTSDKIYAKQVEFEGVQYVAYLTNEADEHEDTTLLFDPTQPNSIDSLYVANDHLGIRRLVFADSSKRCLIDQEVGVWWRVVKLESLCVGGLIQCCGDGLKMRDLSGETTELPKDYWGLPHFPLGGFWFVSLRFGEPSYRMSVEPCNDPRTTGYSLCWNRGIHVLHAHRDGEKLDFYQSSRFTGEDALWFYMPLRAGELVTEIWKLDGPHRESIALVMLTNHGRSCFLGAQPRPNWSRNDWVLVDRPKKSPSRMYAEMTPRGIRRLSFERSSAFGIHGLEFDRHENGHPGPTPRVDWPTSACPTSARGEYFACNKATLSKVAQIVPCQRREEGKLIIIGLLLRYADENHACVGQVRLDCLGKALDVDSARRLWFGFFMADDRPRISNITLAAQQPASQDCDAWFGVGWRDDLEWWFSHRQCQLAYRGRRSPETTSTGRRVNHN